MKPMHLIFSLFAALFLCSCASYTTADYPASIAYRGSQPTKFGKGTVYNFRVSNTSRKSLFYYGYASDYPSYNRQIWNGSQWRPDAGKGGRSFYRLAPGGSFVFHAYRGSYSPWRVGIRLALEPSQAAADSKGVTVWSQSVP